MKVLDRTKTLYMKTSKTSFMTKQGLFKMFIVALCSLGIIACDNDSEPSPGDDASVLEAVWVVTSAVAENCDDASENGTFTSVCTPTDCLSVEFRADGTFVSTELEDGVTTTDEGTYTVSGNQLTLTEGGMSEVATFSIDGNTLTLSGSDAETGCDFTTSLTKED